MLKELTISNYALIDKTDLNLDEGMTIITGETGAGKSIMLGALGLILGQRADVQVLLNKEKKCVVEATFDVSKLDLEETFKAEDVEFDQETIIRREIMPNGKSRAFVNDTPVNVSFLKTIGQSLIDIHSQHQNLLIADNSFQLEVIDAVAKDEVEKLEYTTAYKEYKHLIDKEKKLIESNEKLQRDADYMSFQYKELEEAQLRVGELEELETEHSTLINAESIKEALLHATEMIGGEGNVLSMLNSAENKISKIENFLSKDIDAVARIENSRIDLNDLHKSLEGIAERIEYDPERIAEIDRRCDMLNALLKKHHKSEIGELIEIRDELEEKLKIVLDFDTEIEELKKRIKAKEEDLCKKANALSEKRNAAEPSIIETIENYLHGMGMQNAKFIIKHTDAEDYTPSGKDDISFMFAANKNGEPTDIAKVASGGEMSRVMLSIKSLLSKSKSLPTIIFDEIDTGVSGEVADKMGRIMTEISENMQVIAITHLPQVAAKGKTHYRVYKQDTDDRTISNIEKLDNKQRIEEIAKMLSGAQITEAALENAKALMK